MTRLTTFALLLGFGALVSLPAADSPAKKNVLILGDSISIGYTPIVQKLLAEQAVVMRPLQKGGKAENCMDTTLGLERIDRWLKLETGKWDVIHFNWGLHDIKHMSADGKPTENARDPLLNDVEKYEKQLRELVSKMKATGAKLIFATTTPVPDEKMKIYRSNEDVIRYNEAAVRVMKENNVPVDDLYAFVRPREAKLQLPANVHYNAEGYKALAEEVTRSIQQVLK